MTGQDTINTEAAGFIKISLDKTKHCGSFFRKSDFDLCWDGKIDVKSREHNSDIKSVFTLCELLLAGQLIDWMSGVT